MSHQGPSLIVQSPAKLNVFLRILGRRQDGYHNLETLMVSVRLFDSLRFSPSESSEIELNCGSCLRPSSPLPNDVRNLIVRAARLLRSETGCRLGAKITLFKRIPMEAGLGGGSSNAAATLCALNELWRLKLDREHLHNLAARLGSDVNFFLDSPVAAVCRGRGEQVHPLQLTKPLHFVIAKPPDGLSTARVFESWLNSQDVGRFQMAGAIRALTGSGGGRLSTVLENDLCPPARRLSPKVDQVLSRLGTANVRYAGLTGSGSACFAVCWSRRQALTLAGRCRNQRLGQVFVTTSGV